MVRADTMTPEEAKQRLVDMQRQMRERQRAFAKRKTAEGFKRINAFISPKAFDILDRERKRTGNNTGDVLTTIIEQFVKPEQDQKKRITTNDVPRGTKRKTNAKNTAPGYDRAEALQRVIALFADGLTHRQIAERLTAEGIPTARGGAWNRGTVGKMLAEWERTGKK